MLSKCTQGLYTICPSDMVLRTAGESNCLIALFLGKADIVFSKCKRLILHLLFDPFGFVLLTIIIGFIVSVHRRGSQCSARRQDLPQTRNKVILL
jgi:hypothetical protein